MTMCAWPTSPRLDSPSWLHLVSKWAVLGDFHRTWSELFSAFDRSTFFQMTTGRGSAPGNNSMNKQLCFCFTDIKKLDIVLSNDEVAGD
jgi:hypothetical protein